MKPAPHLSKLLKNARKELCLSQTDLSRACGIAPKRISDFECGRLRPKSGEIEPLSRTLQIPQTQLKLATASLVNQEMKKIKRRFWEETEAVIRRDRASVKRYWAARNEYSELTRKLEKRLQKRPDAKAIRVYLREARFDSRLEYLAHLILLDRGAVTDRVSPQRVGIRHLPVVDPKTKLISGHQTYPALGLNGELFIPQLSLLTRIGVVTLDLAWGQRVNHQTLWSDIEIDGAGHSKYRDPERKQAVRMPVLRYTESEIVGGHFLTGERCA